jgi:autotransporter passenger strand-loop-strand repeat protein
MVSNGGRELVADGGTANGTIISNGGSQQVLGIAVSTSILSGGTEELMDDTPGTAQSFSAIVGNGGLLKIDDFTSEDTANSTIVESGGLILVGVNGTTVDTILAGYREC